VKRQLFLVISGIVGLLLAAPLFAQTSGAATVSEGHAKWVVITAGFAMAIASAGCGLGQGRAAAGACEGLARNPGARAGIQFLLIFSLILIESEALYTFAIIFAKVK